VIGTKGRWRITDDPNDLGASRHHLLAAVEASLRRLDTDYIDLYQCHQWDDSTPIEETMATLDGFVRSGKVRYLGCSNFTAAQIVESQWAAQRTNGTPFISLQPQYSLIARGIEAEILPTCGRHGLGTLVWSPLGGGVLAGRYHRDRTPDPDTRAGRLRASPLPRASAWADTMLSEQNLTIAERVAKTAAELDTTPTAVALAWLWRQPGVTSVIVGPRSTDQLNGNLAGLALHLPPATVAALNDISASATTTPNNGMNTQR
jgi:aryl-alcohol dehydrogenase-like predicted oxidoreductase